VAVDYLMDQGENSQKLETFGQRTFPFSYTETLPTAGMYGF